MENKEQILRKAYAAFNARDIEGVLALMAPDVEWPNGMEGGWVHGHRGVREYWTRQWKLIDPHVEPVAFAEESPGRMAVEVHQTVRSLDGGLLADNMVEHIYTIEEGNITKMEIREA